MTEEKQRLRYWVLGENWPEGWFLLSLLAGLFWGLPGLIGAVTSYVGLRAVGSTLPRLLAVVAALALAIVSVMASKALLHQ